jgi:hypothetical protein
MATTTPPAGNVAGQEDPNAEVQKDRDAEAVREEREPEDAGTREDDEGEVPAARDPAWGAWVVLAGLAATVITVVVAVLALDRAGEIVQVTAPAFAVITGLVAAYFGVRAGSLAAERVQGAAADEPPPGMSARQQREFLRGKRPLPRRRRRRRRDRDER